MVSTARAERKLTEYQIRILKVLKRKPHTASETVELLNKAAARRTGYMFGGAESYESVHSALRRLENRGYVRRVVEDRRKGGFATVWELTSKGSNAVS